MGDWVCGIASCPIWIQNVATCQYILAAAWQLAQATQLGPYRTIAVLQVPHMSDV